MPGNMSRLNGRASLSNGWRQYVPQASCNSGTAVPALVYGLKKNYPTHHIPHLAGHSIDIIVNRAAIVVSGTRYAMPAPMKVLKALCTVYTAICQGSCQ